MDEIYVCFPGEIVLVNDESPSSKDLYGILAIVSCIRKGKVLLQIIPSSQELLLNPNQFMDSGEYGFDVRHVVRFNKEFGLVPKVSMHI